MNVLKKKRKELGITQIQAANACGVSRRTYQTYEESDVSNATFDELVKKLNEMGVMDGSNYIPNVRYIKNITKELFINEYPEIESAYLFGDYVRGEATWKSKIRILIICSHVDIKFHKIVTNLENRLHKKVDLYSHKQLMEDESLLKEILKEGIKIY